MYDNELIYLMFDWTIAQIPALVLHEYIAHFANSATVLLG